MKVLFHTRSVEKTDWEDQEIQLHDFGRLPILGDFICTESDASDWHRVALVVHVTFPADYMAEIFCVRVNHLEAMKEATK